MINLIPDLPGHVIGFRATGKVTAEDYEKVVIPSVEGWLVTHAKARLLFHLDEGFEGFTLGAMWDDARLGLYHLRQWERVAIVTESMALRTAIRVLGFTMPGHVHVYHEDEMTQALEWVAS